MSISPADVCNSATLSWYWLIAFSSLLLAFAAVDGALVVAAESGATVETLSMFVVVLSGFAGPQARAASANAAKMTLFKRHPPFGGRMLYQVVGRGSWVVGKAKPTYDLRPATCPYGTAGEIIGLSDCAVMWMSPSSA